MKSLKYVSEKDFKDEKIVVDDDHYNLAKNILEMLGVDACVNEIIVDKNHNLRVCANFEHDDRVKKELGERKYIITIHKA